MPTDGDAQRKPPTDALTTARTRRTRAYAIVLAVGITAAAMIASATTERKPAPSLVVKSKIELEKETVITQALWHHLVQIEWHLDRPAGLARSPADLFDTTVFEKCEPGTAFNEPKFYSPKQDSKKPPVPNDGCTAFRKAAEKKAEPPPRPVLHYSVVEVAQSPQPPIRMAEPEPLPFPLRLYRPQSAKYLGSVWFLHDAPGRSPGATCVEMKPVPLDAHLNALDAHLNAEDAPSKIGRGLLRRIEQELGQPDREVIIIGHADETGNEERNQQLSTWRAEYVRCLVYEAGFGPDRLRTIATYALGEKAPLAAVAAPQVAAPRVPQRHPVNRRVDIFIVRAEHTPR